MTGNMQASPCGNTEYISNNIGPYVNELDSLSHSREDIYLLFNSL